MALRMAADPVDAGPADDPAAAGRLAGLAAMAELGSACAIAFGFVAVCRVVLERRRG